MKKNLLRKSTVLILFIALNSCSIFKYYPSGKSFTVYYIDVEVERQNYSPNTDDLGLFFSDPLEELMYRSQNISLPHCPRYDEYRKNNRLTKLIVSKRGYDYIKSNEKGKNILIMNYRGQCNFSNGGSDVHTLNFQSDSSLLIPMAFNKNEFIYKIDPSSEAKFHGINAEINQNKLETDYSIIGSDSTKYDIKEIHEISIFKNVKLQIDRTESYCI